MTAATWIQSLDSPAKQLFQSRMSPTGSAGVPAGIRLRNRKDKLRTSAAPSLIPRYNWRTHSRRTEDSGANSPPVSTRVERSGSSAAFLRPIATAMPHSFNLINHTFFQHLVWISMGVILLTTNDIGRGSSPYSLLLFATFAPLNESNPGPMVRESNHAEISEPAPNRVACLERLPPLQ